MSRTFMMIKRAQIRTQARVVTIALVLLAGCLAASPLAAKTLRLASAFDPQSMDPHGLALQYQTRVVSQIYESLVSRDRNFELAPTLAYSRSGGRWPRIRNGHFSCAGSSPRIRSMT